MSRTIKYILTGVFVLNITARCQTSPVAIGGRANGLGYATACVEDAWALLNNVAGIAKVKNISAAFAYDVNPSFKPFNRMAATIVVPFRHFTSGAGVYKFGDNLYSEQIISIGVANTLGLASLGLKANLLQYSIEGFGIIKAVTISFGGIARLTPKLSVGAHIQSLNRPKSLDSNQNFFSNTMSLAMAFQPSEKVFITSQLEKDLYHELISRSAFEYRINKKFSARTGFTPKPQTAFFGFGFTRKKLSIDYSIQLQSIGTRHQASVGYQFSKP